MLLNSRTWGDHYAGVVARDGTDVITLENYARNAEDAGQPPDERYYFQMYQTDPAQPGDTWHTAWTSTPMQAIPAPVPAVTPPNPAPTHRPVTPGARSFTNPLTMRYAPAATRWDAIATTLYGGVAVDTIKDDHANVAGAADAHTEIREVLKGLRYANVRLQNQHKGDKARTGAWMAALTAAIGQRHFEENRQALVRTHARMMDLRAL